MSPSQLPRHATVSCSYAYFLTALLAVRLEPPARNCESRAARVKVNRLCTKQNASVPPVLRK
jgi:hypothetical protein